MALSAETVAALEEAKAAVEAWYEAERARIEGQADLLKKVSVPTDVADGANSTATTSALDKINSLRSL